MNLTIFTSCYGKKYAEFLPEWEGCMAALPVEAVVVGDIHAQSAWGGTGRFILAPQHGSPYNQGAAHNHAALESRPEWLMHVGVDDLVTPDLVEQLRPHADHADVIAVDVQRTRNGTLGTIRQNRPTKDTILQPTMGRQPLDACAAFRRSFWERTGYRTDLPGGVDVALWIDMAHQGARFAYTGQVGVIYRLRPESLWHQRSKQNVNLVRRALNGLRQPG
jgi:hypothetical protein